MVTSDDSIQKLNKTYRGIDKPTNVLSFPMQDGKFTDISPELLGDIVISCETAQKEAESDQINLSERISQLLVHGILHLTGFDHESDAPKMEIKSLELLKMIEANDKLDAF